MGLIPKATTPRTADSRRSNKTTTTTSGSNGGLMSRLRPRKTEPNATVTTKESTNPITGSHKTVQTTKSHPNGVGSHGHGGTGPMASSRTTGNTTTGRSTGRSTGGDFTGGSRTHHTQQRDPTTGDKVGGGLTKLKGSLTGKSGVKGAGTKQMRGTDGRGSRRVL